VSARKDADQKLFDDLFLADDDFADFSAHPSVKLTQLVNGSDIIRVMRRGGLRINHINKTGQQPGDAGAPQS
jgi:hypothetical protein